GQQTATVEETASANVSSLSYDPVTGQYTYIWKTDKGWKGTCRQLVLVFNDGPPHSATFSFK
ncbi:MAG TPA: PxKF domain-containing protein, partial [Blastocatellia bacterium]|nr:PxKF domain-containing protein [Blastocatellia bacterium]